MTASSSRPPQIGEASPLGVAAILRQHPFSQSAKTKKLPAPLVYAASKWVRTEAKFAYAWFARAFREAAEYLRAGDRLARFPRGSFPPGLPFVQGGLAISPATVSVGERPAWNGEARFPGTMRPTDERY